MVTIHRQNKTLKTKLMVQEIVYLLKNFHLPLQFPNTVFTGIKTVGYKRAGLLLITKVSLPPLMISWCVM